MDPLKDRYNLFFFNDFLEDFTPFCSGLDSSKFKQLIFNKAWKSMELKERMHHTTKVLHTFLPNTFREAQTILLAFVNHMLDKKKKVQSFEYLFLPDYIEQYGLEHPEIAIPAIEKITQFISCEFAIRPFIIQDQTTTLNYMLQWSKHKNEHVRRLASEGCRPRLPWAMALPKLKKDPSPILPILENLKKDSSLYVRRSVANNINDISKDHPEKVVVLAQSWYGNSKEVDWVVKHACRTLLKKGHQTLMQLFGFGKPTSIKIQDFKINTPIVKIGEHLNFSCTLENTSKTEQLLRLEYAIYYKKANGTHARKVFKISEKKYAAQSIQKIERNQSFRIITTRKFYTGTQKIALIINGQEMEIHVFELQ